MFANKFDIINLKGDDMSVLCSQLISAAPKWPKKKSAIAGLTVEFPCKQTTFLFTLNVVCFFFVFIISIIVYF